MTRRPPTGAPATVVPLAPHDQPRAARPGASRRPSAASAGIVFMGGGADISNATAAAEFNVFHDPEAAAIVLDARADHGIPVTMYGLDVFYDPLVTDVDVAGSSRARQPTSRRLARADLRSTTGGSPTRGATIGDAGAVGILLDRMPCRPSGCRCASSSPARGPAVAPSSTAATGRGTWTTTRTGSAPAGRRGASRSTAPRIADLWVRTLRGEAP